MCKVDSHSLGSTSINLKGDTERFVEEALIF